IDINNRRVAGGDASSTEEKTVYRTFHTPNGKILRLHFQEHSSVQSKSIELYDPKTKASKVLQYNWGGLPDSTLPLVIGIRNEKGQEALYSTLDLSAIIPFGMYTNLSVAYMRNPPKGMKKGVMISGIAYKNGEQYPIGGFYSVEGIKYWEDK